MKTLYDNNAILNGEYFLHAEECEKLLRKFIIKNAKNGISVRDSLLLIHDYASAAAQHALNKLDADNNK